MHTKPAQRVVMKMTVFLKKVVLILRVAAPHLLTIKVLVEVQDKGEKLLVWPLKSTPCRQGRQCRPVLKAQGCWAGALPTFTMSLNPINESEDIYGLMTDAFQPHDAPSVNEYLSGITGLDIEMVPEDESDLQDADSDTSQNMDHTDIDISEDELDEDIRQLAYHPKPAAVHALINQKWRPGRPKSSSKPIMTESDNADEFENSEL